MRKQLLLLLALAACRQSDASSDMAMIKQVAAEKSSSAPAAEPNDQPAIISDVAEASKPEGPSAIIKTDSDEGSMWGAADSDNPIRGKAAHELASKFPLPVPDDLGLTMLIFKKSDKSWFISYSTQRSVKDVGDLYKKAYTAKGLELDHTLAIEETKEEWLQLGAESTEIHALATIKREDKVTTVIVQWEPKDQRRRRF